MAICGWVLAGLAAWFLGALPLAVIVGRHLRRHQPPDDQ